ncbi:hypothetical protein RhiirA1_470324 [Rhizophagus irregularis]|uniref:F-box domain-containing protein n=1 Tax=Rhizophagus irregularis TaxID=588596 RepID=A0A2N0R6G9_9GLOM|nr:hypothetical protein RhiirA1_470793 [Rhizophagus irregularis]PKC58870.1 hypothetical protein RhiirA1_470324 [Rhizophagus irregularis]
MSLNRQFCEIAVRICEEMFGIFKIFLKKIMMESKDLLQKEEFFIINLTQTRKPPLFNYPSFIKVITIRGIKRIIRNFPFDTKDFDSLHCIRMQLWCCSNICSEFFINYLKCHNIQSLNLNFIPLTSNGLKELIFSQNNFKTFLEINGKNSIDLYIPENPDNSLNLTIAKFCPNLKILSIVFEEDEFETFKLILNNCQYLKIIRLQYNAERCSNIKTFLRICEELEEFFINWKDRIPQKSLSLVITSSNIKLEELEEYMKIMIENYKKMGIIREFRITYYGILELYFIKL